MRPEQEGWGWGGEEEDALAPARGCALGLALGGLGWLVWLGLLVLVARVLGVW